MDRWTHKISILYIRLSDCDARHTDLYEVKADVLVERVESKFSQSMVAPCSMHKQQLVEKSELEINISNSKAPFKVLTVSIQSVAHNQSKKVPSNILECHLRDDACKP